MSVRRGGSIGRAAPTDVRPSAKRPVRRARVALAAAGWVTIALGVVHVGATAVLFDAFTDAALWFASGGLALLLIGAVDLLAVDAPPRAPARWVAAGANVAGGLLHGVAFSVVTHWRAPQGPFFLAVAAVAVAAALRPPPRTG